MLHLIPPPLHRQLYRMAHFARKTWLRATKADVRGTSIIARDTEGRVLLVRHSYGVPVWAFPGGGMKKHEDPLASALREFSEELGCTVSDPQHIGTLTELYHGTNNIAHIFTGLIDGEPRPDMRELVDARFFERDDLPEFIGGNVAPRLALMDQLLAQD